MTRNVSHSIAAINLLERFGKRFRITFDEAFDPRGKHSPDCWAMQIPCAFKGVTLYAHGGPRLAVEINGHRELARRVSLLEGVALHQNGDDEKTFLFDVAQFEQVAVLVKPKRRIRLTEERRKKAVANLTPFPRSP